MSYLPAKDKKVSTLTTEFKGEKFLSLCPCMQDKLPNYIRGSMYWVMFGGEGQLAYHIQDGEESKYPVEFVNN